MNAPRNAKRKSFPPNLYQREDGYFYYRNPQSKKIKGLGRDKAKAFQEARAANAQLAVMSKSSLVAWVSGIEQHTVSAWLDKYIPLWTEESKPAPGTLASAKRCIERVRKSDFAHLQVSDVTTKHVADYLDNLLKESTPSVVINLRARLSDVFRLAETKGLIETGKNPVSSTSVPEYKVKRERLSLDQYLKIRAAVSGWKANAMDLALLTGQRREDILNIKFVDYKGGFLHIIQGKTGHKLQQDGRIRLEAVGLSIDDVVKRCRDRIISKYLIHHTRTSGKYKAGDPISLDGLSDAFAIARDKAGIVATEKGKTPPSFHEIRSLSERLYKKEYGAEFSQAIMGHKHAKMTAEYDDLRGAGWNVVEAK